jgi:hypothetical protein
MIFSPWNLLTQKPKEIRTLKNSGKLLLMIWLSNRWCPLPPLSISAF